MTQIVRLVKDWQELSSGRGGVNELKESKSLGFVPTMGNLHSGHRRLLEQSVEENDYTVLSIFVNPTQFDNKQDLEKYLRTLDSDIEMAREAKVDYIFIPEYLSLYPDNYSYKVQESRISNLMEGKSRPGHFDGMLTVVLKLLQLIKATRAYFGEKDYQQLDLVRGMVKAFFIDTEIVACPTIRDKNGLALSSRNSRLSPEGYLKAVEFAQALKMGTSAEDVVQKLLELGIEVDYVEDVGGRRYGAVRVEGVRLIDNRLIESSRQN